MPNRIIKETINESRSLNACSIFAQDLYKRLITYADDYGRFNADTVVMRARLFPRELDVVSEEDIVNGLIELVGVNKIAFYTPVVFNQYGKKGVYGAFPNWGEHQRIRDSKHKCPDPEDTAVNDWYLRRFIPLELRAAVIQRDDFKCQICKKQITPCKDAKRFIKMGTGLYHIDHIVPVLQGGRATIENLRLTCVECNLKRKKQFSFDEILAFSSDPQNVAETCGELPPNPIQSESNPNPNPNPNSSSRMKRPTLDEVQEYISENHYAVNASEFIDYYESNGWKVGRNPMKDWKATVRKWNSNEQKRFNERNKKGELPF